MSKINFGITRLKLHKFDALLYKKHPIRAKKFFDIRFGFIRNPIIDFKIATGMWKGSFELSSPQGVVLVSGKSTLGKITVILLGIVYVFAVTLVRLYSSIKYRKLLL